MKKAFLNANGYRVTAVVILLCLVFSLTSCAARYSDVLDGIWYEQVSDGGVLEIKGSQITYSDRSGDYSTSFKAEEVGDTIVITPENEDFFFSDITYYRDDYSVLCHTGSPQVRDTYYSVTFRRGVYIEPEPVAGDVIDHTDENAVKDFDDYSFSVLSVKFFQQELQSEEGEEDDKSVTVPGEYEYTLTVSEDGTGRLVSSAFPEVAVKAERISQVAQLIKESGIASHNGYDCRIYQLEKGEKDYTLDISFRSGEKLYSSANGRFVTERWDAFQTDLQDLLFSIVVEGGYDPETGDFHSTEPMKRIGMSEASQDRFSISTSEQRIEKEGKAYTYVNYVDYVTFTGGDNAHSALVAKLKEMNEEFRKRSEKELEDQYDLMEAVPSSQRTGDDITVYSFYSVDTLHSDPMIFWFRISEGHGNTLGVGPYGTSVYMYERYCFDSQTGERVSVSDLFNDETSLEEEIIRRMLEVFSGGDHEEYLRSGEFRQGLHDMLTDPETYGYIEWEPSYNALTVFIPQQLTPDFEYRVDLLFYYDDYQEMLSDRYTSVW